MESFGILIVLGQRIVFSITLSGGQSRTKGAVTISKDTDKIGNFYIQVKKMEESVFSTDFSVMILGKKGPSLLRLQLIRFDSGGYYTGKVETNTFVFSEFKIEPTLQKSDEKKKNRIGIDNNQKPVWMT